MNSLKNAGYQVIITDAVDYEATRKSANGTPSNPPNARQQLTEQWIQSNVSDNNLTFQNTSYQSDIQSGYLPPDAGEKSIVEKINAQTSGTVYQVGSDNIKDFVNLGVPSSNVNGVVATMNTLESTTLSGGGKALDPLSYASLRDQLNQVPPTTNGQTAIPQATSLLNDPTLNVAPELPFNGGPLQYRLTSAAEDAGTVAVNMAPTATALAGEPLAQAIAQEANQLALDLGAAGGSASGLVTAIETLGKYVAPLGVAAMVYDFAATADAAEGDIRQSNDQAASTLMAQWAARTLLVVARAANDNCRVPMRLLDGKADSWRQAA